MPSEETQHARLRELMDSMSGWGAMIYLHKRGDVAFLTPIVPELRGYEIVAAAPADNVYDVWRDGEMVLGDMSKSDVGHWLLEQRPPVTDREMRTQTSQWAEDTLRHFGIAPKEAGG